MTTYFKVEYDNEASGPFVADAENFDELTWTGGGRGQIITLFDNGTTGRLHVALIAGALPSDNDTLTQNTTTADANLDATEMLYPAYQKADSSVTTNGALKDVRWTGPAPDGNGVIPTHSFKYDSQTVNLTVGETLTFSGGQTAELIRVNNDVGATGECEVRMITDLDTGLPVDGNTFTDEGTGNGTMQGEMHPRVYSVEHLHRFLSDLNDDPQFDGNDVLSFLDPTPSDRSTGQIIALIGGANIDDTYSLHMFGGSIDQDGGDTKYAGLDVGVTSPNAATRPVLVQFDTATGLDAIISDYYSNAFMPDSIAGNIRILLKIRENGVDIDGRRIKGKLLEFGDSFFEGGTTLGDATTSLALFSSNDGNNNTAVGTVAGAPYNTVVLTEGFQTLDYSNGNGATDFALSLDFGSASSLQAYERTKYVQRRGTAETLFGRNAALVTGVNTNFTHDAEAGALTEDEIIVWGTEIPYTGEAGGPFTVGEAVSFGTSGAVGRIYYLDDNGATGTVIVGDVEGTPQNTEVMTGQDSGATANTGTVVINAAFGMGLLMAYDDDGTTGNVYYQTIAGIDPADNQTVFGRTSNNSVDVNGAVSSRTINNQFIGGYTGTNYQTNFGVGVDPTDAILGDQNNNLLGATQTVPNNQSGVLTGLSVGDRGVCYPWDGSTLDLNGNPVPDYDHLSLDTTLSGAAVTSVVITSLPAGTPVPSAAKLRVQTDGGVRRLINYSAFDGTDTFTIPATDFSGDNATAANDVTIAYIDEDVLSGSQLSFTAVYGGDFNMMTAVKRGDNSPVKPSYSSPSFTATGFSVPVSRISDA